MSNPILSSENKSKQAAGFAAAQIVQEGMLVGLGTGSTAVCFIESLILRCRNGLKIQAVSSSERSADLARQGGIPIVDINQITSIDLTVDGADEIDPDKRMIKGGGGALLHEKILASSSREMVVIVDETKLVKQLGAFPLPIEIVTFGLNLTLHKLKNLGYQGALRKTGDNKLFMTESGNYIYDIKFPEKIRNPERVQEEIANIPGVVETGLFFNLAGRVIIGYPDGSTEIRS